MATKKAASSVKYFGMKPTELASGGGMPEGVYEVVGAKTCHWNYNKPVDLDSDRLSTFAMLALMPCDKKGKQVKGAKEIEQHWSAGQASKILPSKDGKHFKAGPESNQDGISNQSNWGFFLQQFGALGADDSFIQPDITCWVGMKAKFVNVPQPERSQMAALEDEDGSKKANRTIPVIAEVLTYPDGAAGEEADEEEEDEKPAKAAKKAPAKAAKAAKEEEEEEESEEEEEEEEEEESEEEEEGEEEGEESAEELFKSSIAKVFKAGKPVKVKMLNVEVFKLLKGNDAQEDVGKMFKDAKAVAAAVKAAGYKLDGEMYVKGK